MQKAQFSDPPKSSASFFF